MAAIAQSSSSSLTLKDTSVPTLIAPNVLGQLHYLLNGCYSKLTLGDRLCRWWFHLWLLSWRFAWLLELIYEIALLWNVYRPLLFSWSPQVDPSQVPYLWCYVIASSLMTLFLTIYVVPMCHWTHKLSLVFHRNDISSQNQFIAIEASQVNHTVLATNEALLGTRVGLKSKVDIMFYKSSWGNYHKRFMFFIWYWNAFGAWAYTRMFGGLNERIIFCLITAAPQLVLYALVVVLLRHFTCYRSHLVRLAKN